MLPALMESFGKEQMDGFIGKARRGADGGKSGPAVGGETGLFGQLPFGTGQ